MARRVNIASLNIRILGQTQGLRAAVNRAEDTIRGFGETAQRNAGRLRTLTAAGAKLAAALAAIGAVRVASELVGSAVRAAAEFERMQVSFRVLIGDVQRADALLSDLERFGAVTPFQLDQDLLPAARQLIAYGVEAENVVATLKTLGDTAAGSASQIGDIAQIYGRIVGENRATNEDLNRFADRAIPIYTAVGDVLGVTQAEVRKLASESKISAAEVQQALIDLTTEGGKFADQMAAQSETAVGQYSNLQDEIEALKKEIGEELLPVAKELLQAFRDFAVSLDGEQIGQVLAGLAEAAITLGRWIAGITVATSGLFNLILAGVARITEAVTGLFGDNSISRAARIFGDEWEREFKALNAQANRLFHGVETNAGNAAKTFSEGLESVDGAGLGNALEREARAASAALEKMTTDATKAAERIREANRTPEQVFSDAVENIERAIQLGGLSEAVGARAIRGELEAFTAAVNDAQAALRVQTAIRRGSVEDEIARFQREIARAGDIGGIGARAAEIEAAARQAIQLKIGGLQAADSLIGPTTELREGPSAEATARNTARIGELVAAQAVTNQRLMKLIDKPAAPPIQVREFSR